MIILPKKLQNKSFRFIKIIPGKKLPSELDWPMTNNYKYNDPDFIEYLKTATAYGVACGFGQLAIIDCDNKDSAERIMSILPDTFTIFTPGHESPHLYFIIKDLTEKIVMNDDKGIHHGEVQFTGAQALGPRSLHPNKKKYSVLKDIPITHITKKELLAAIKPFMRKEKKVKLCESGIKMSISVVAAQIKGLTEKNGELVGAHPMHGSEGGSNFRINETTDRWHCFRDNVGGDAISLIALIEDLVPCGELVQGYFSTADGKEVFKKALKIAKKKYKYRTEKEIAQEEQIAIARPLTESEIAELKNPALIFNILREVQNQGVVGEEKSILTLINRIAMRCVLNITKTSGNLIILDDTGLGKDNMAEKLCHIMLVKNKTLFSASNITDKVLNYWNPGTPETSWNGRVIYLQDPAEDTLKGQAFKIRASGKNENVTLDTERKVQYIKIVGKPILIITSMKTGLDIELVRRWDSVHLDPSPELTSAIIKQQLLLASTGNANIRVNEVLQGALQNLPAANVLIPFAPELANIINSDATIMRTTTSKVLDIIKASAALHQFQRKKNKEGFILATKEDLAYAIFIVNHCEILGGHTLNRKQEQLLSYVLSKGGEEVSFKQIVKDNPGMSEAWVYRQEHDLVERRLLQMVKEFDPGAGRDIKCYKPDIYLVSEGVAPIKTPEKLPGYFFNRLEDDINESRKRYGLKKIKLFED